MESSIRSVAVDLADFQGVRPVSFSINYLRLNSSLAGLETRRGGTYRKGRNRSPATLRAAIRLSGASLGRDIIAHFRDRCDISEIRPIGRTSRWRAGCHWWGVPRAVFDGDKLAIAPRCHRRTQARAKCRAVVQFAEDKLKSEGQLEAMESSGCQVVGV